MPSGFPYSAEPPARIASGAAADADSPLPRVLAEKWRRKLALALEGKNKPAGPQRKADLDSVFRVHTLLAENWS